MIEEVKRTKIKPNTQPFSRYRNLERIRYEDGVEIVETPDRVVIGRSSQDQYFEVTDEYMNRLDLVAHRFYNNTRLWWVIAYASNIINPFEIPVGTKLRIPPLSVAISDEVV